MKIERRCLSEVFLHSWVVTYILAVKLNMNGCPFLPRDRSCTVFLELNQRLNLAEIIVALHIDACLVLAL